MHFWQDIQSEFDIILDDWLCHETLVLFTRMELIGELEKMFGICDMIWKGKASVLCFDKFTMTVF